MIRTIRRGAAASIALTFVTAVAASAHPVFNPADLPPGEAVETLLVVPHACGDSQDIATTAIEVAWDDRVRPLPQQAEGWEPFVEPGTAWGWHEVGGATTDPIVLPVAISVDGAVGDALDLIVRQTCGTEVMLWGVGEPDYPALRINVTEQVGEAGTDGAMDMGHGQDEAADGEQAEGATDEGPADDHADEAMDDHADDAMDDQGDEVLDAEHAAEEGSAGLDTLTVVVMAVVVLLGIGGILVSSKPKA